MANVDPPTYLSITNVVVLKTLIIAILGYQASASDFQFSLSLLVTGEKMSSFSQMWYLSLPAVPSEVYLTKRYVNTSSFPYKNAQITDIYGIYAVKSRVNNVVNYALLELTLTPVVQFFDKYYLVSHSALNCEEAMSKYNILDLMLTIYPTINERWHTVSRC